VVSADYDSAPGMAQWLQARLSSLAAQDWDEAALEDAGGGPGTSVVLPTARGKVSYPARSR
jgi:hypothetical protein